jgi:Nucleoside-diphosphate-sugar epimerases
MFRIPVNVYLCAIKSNDIIGEVVNLGNNYEISIGDLAKTLAKIMNQEIIVEQDDERLRPKKSEVERLCANNKKAIEILKWKPLFHGKMGLEEGLHITIEWFKVNKNLSKYKSDIFNI